MQSDFSQPQKQSPIGVLVMFADTIRHFIKALWPILLIYAIRMNDVSRLYLMVGIPVFVLLLSIIAYLRYRNFTFYIDDLNDEFIISSGIFNKTRTAVRLDRIQQVNISQSLIQRLINVYALDVDTAGTGDQEAKIRAVSHSLAIALKERLLDNRFNNTTSSDEVDKIESSSPFIKIGFWTLVKVGLTSNYLRTISVLLAFIVTTYENLRQVLQGRSFDSDRFSGYFEQQMVVMSTLILLFLFLTAILLINLIRVIIKYYDFTVNKQSGSLLLSYGLLSKKSTIIKPEKVQVTTLTRNYFQKRMDITEIKIRQASSGEAPEKKLAVEIPGCSSDERDSIMRLLFTVVPERGIMLKPNFRRLVFSLFISIVLPLTVFVVIGIMAEPDIFQFSAIVPLYILLVGSVLFFAFRNYRLFIGPDFIIKQSGAWDISSEIVEPDKIQALTTSQLFWHKALNIGTLTIHTAGGEVTFNLGNYSAIRDYVNLWLFNIENSDSNWM